MELFSTSGLPTAGRTAAWSAIYAARMSRCEFTPRGKSQFDAELRIGQLGPIKLARLSLNPCSVERRQSDIGADTPRLYSFLLQAQGSSVFHQCGKESQLLEGDFVLCDTGLPHYFVTNGPSVTVMVRVAPSVLREYLPTPERYCGQHLGRAVGLTSTVAAMVRELSARDGGGIDRAYEDRVARYLIEMISMSFTMGCDSGQDGSAITWQRRQDVVQYIEDHLRDPELSPGTVARGLRVSHRHLRTVFATGGERMSAYILRRRLEECARQLASPAWKAHTLTEIAYSWGFNSAAHFTRTFHAHYGMSPRQYRNKHLPTN